MGRAPCCDKANVKKGPWSPEEDAKLKEYIEKFGTGGNWIALPQKAGLKRCGKSCRLRWLNYLRPNIRHGEFSDDEDRIICSLYATIGSRWSVIAAQLPGRTDNDIKNYWNTKLKKKLLTMFPSLQEKHTFFPSAISFQPPPPPYDDHINNISSSSAHHQFFNTSSSSSSSFCTNYFSPNLMNNNVVDNTSNSLLRHDDHHLVNVIGFSSSAAPQSPHVNSLMTTNNNINNYDHHNSSSFYNSIHSGLFQADDDDHQSMCNNSPIMHPHYHHTNSSSSAPAAMIKEGMLMLGSASCSSSEDLHQNQQYHQIKQEYDDELTILHDHALGDHHQTYTPISFMIDDHKHNQYDMIKNHVAAAAGPLANTDLGEEVKQLNLSNYLLFNNDGDETNKTTHYQKGMCSYDYY